MLVYEAVHGYRPMKLVTHANFTDVVRGFLQFWLMQNELDSLNPSYRFYKTARLAKFFAAIEKELIFDNK